MGRPAEIEAKAQCTSAGLSYIVIVCYVSYYKSNSGFIFIVPMVYYEIIFIRNGVVFSCIVISIVKSAGVCRMEIEGSEIYLL